MKKNSIDKLYQEKLKNFSKVPDEKVWKSIAASLDKKKKSRLILPIWWKLSGAAAILAILLYVFIPFENAQKTDQIITDVESSPSTNNSKANDIENTLQEENNENAASVVSSSDEKTEIGNSVSASPNDRASKVSPSVETSVIVTTEKNTLQTEQKTDKTKPSDPLATIASVRSEKTAGNTGKDETSAKIKEQRLVKNEKSGIAAKINSPDNNPLAPDSENSDIFNKSGLQEAAIANGTAKVIRGKEGEKEKQDVKSDKGKKSIFDEIEKSQETQVAQSNSNRWSVGPSLGPVYFDSFGDGSPIHSNFVSNSKSGNVNLSYGLRVSYDISKKLSIRSGIHRVDYGYDTNEISFSASLTASTNDQIDNINYATTSRNLVVRNMEDSKLSEQTIGLEFVAQSPARNGRMIQDFGYIELPLELNYALLDRKFGINVIGGLSSLFLVSNSVVLEANGNTVEMGEANNINDLNLSTNIGFGLNYKFSPMLQLNLEPMFKYQLNTFTQTAGDFQPFSIGVYTGLNFKF